jgi:hypothetical protein
MPTPAITIQARNPIRVGPGRACGACRAGIRMPRPAASSSTPKISVPPASRLNVMNPGLKLA